jgi:hypothetical protein
MPRPRYGSQPRITSRSSNVISEAPGGEASARPTPAANSSTNVVRTSFTRTLGEVSSYTGSPVGSRGAAFGPSRT